MQGTNFGAPVEEIVAILHKHEIPIAWLPDVFSLVRKDVESNTVPYNPGDRKMPKPKKEA